MKLKTLLATTSVVAFIFGLAFLVFPFQTTSAYGYTLTAELQYIPRYFGATLLGFGALNWAARNAVGEAVAIRAIVIGNLACVAIGLVVALVNSLKLPGNGLIWLTVIIYAVLTVGFGYFQSARREVTSTKTHVGTPGAPIAH